MTCPDFATIKANRDAKKAKRRSNAAFIAKTSGKPKLKSIPWLVKEADRVFSIWIRNRDAKEANGFCVLCRSRIIQDCSHYIARGKKAVRWDERNAAGMCKSCNYRHNRYPHHYANWMTTRYGISVCVRLEKKAKGTHKSDRAELEAIIQKYKLPESE